MKDATGRIQGIYRTHGCNQRVRSVQSNEARRETAITRQFGACPRCRTMKVKVSHLLRGTIFKRYLQALQCPPHPPYHPCGRCEKAGAHLLDQPCITYSIPKILLHRRGR